MTQECNLMSLKRQKPVRLVLNFYTAPWLGYLPTSGLC